MEKRDHFILKDESGAALVVALLMIVILSLIGIASSSNSTFEIRLSGNKRGVTDAFYTSDAGVQSVKPNITNFNTSSGFSPVTISNLPVELQNESIDQSNTAPALVTASGVSFSDAPQVTIYHTTVTQVPRGTGSSAINFEYSYYIIDSIGEDQLGIGTAKSNCQIREKIVRIIPTMQGGY